MGTSYSPLRYPGGKQILSRVISHLISLNGRGGGIYAEPYAGGAGAALALLYGGHVNQLLLNDADDHIYSFWKSVLDETDDFLALIRTVPLSIDEWRRQRSIYLNSKHYSRLEIGFATFYLNRCNRSGVIANAGVIGGLSQTGKWKLDARFNREVLAARIQRIARYKRRIKVSRFDAITFLRRLAMRPTMAERGFVYLDPPYFDKGSQLYMNHYLPEDHQKLHRYLAAGAPFKWVLSYDSVPAIKQLYKLGFSQVPFSLSYSASNRRTGTELLIHDYTLHFPGAWKRGIPDAFITAADLLRKPLPT